MGWSFGELGEAENPIEAVAVVGDSSGNNSHGATDPVGKSRACNGFAQFGLRSVFRVLPAAAAACL
ncbi:hypothetical protein WN943_005985 [Citrus x changshan-huyou]